MNKKLSNRKQIISIYEIMFTSNREKGIEGILVNNGDLELLINKSNALDISFVKYKGKNISFLSKNGLNTNRSSFQEHFEGGFLYTCGLDNISTCVKDAPMHGSLHYAKAENINITSSDDTVIIEGSVRLCGLFQKNLLLKRKYIITDSSISINDEVINEGYLEENYVLLYHINYGYPFLDSCLELNIPTTRIDSVTDIAEKNKDKYLIIQEPEDDFFEHVFYHYLSNGHIELYNPKINTKVTMDYSIDDFPYTIEWKSMASGDYALGIEPSISRFDRFTPRKLKPQESKSYKIDICFK